MKNLIKKIIFTQFIAVWVMNFAVAQSLTGVNLLNKISVSLTGVMLSRQDQQTIQAMTSAEEQKKFIAVKVEQYLKSTEYSNKMTFRMEELFQFQPAKIATYDLAYKPTIRTATASNYLFDSMTTQNRSWDDLLTAKSYVINERALNISKEPVTDYGFYGNLMSLPTATSGYVRSMEDIPEDVEFTRKLIQFPADDVRIAGALTTPRFFARYATTGINKNRRRAAAIFKIFLCDSMSAAIPKSATIEDSVYSMLYPSKASAGITEEEVKAVLNKNDSIHGTRADCRSCHYKLDPMGEVFKFSTTIVASKPAKGALAYKNKDGQLIDIPVNGIGELAQAITQQPAYLDCQVKTFWNWFVGQDKILTPERLNELKTVFNQMGRKTNDFVKYLVLQDEFAQRELPNELRDLGRNTKQYMRRCQSCHNEAGDYFGTDLTVWPLGSKDNNKYDTNYWKNKIVEMLDLDHMGLARKMPPSPLVGGFIPTRQELELIKLWIEKGMPDETGKVQVTK